MKNGKEWQMEGNEKWKGIGNEFMNRKWSIKMESNGNVIPFLMYLKF